MPAYAHEVDDDPVDLACEYLTPAEIEAEQDVATLKAWAAETDDLIADIRAQLMGYEASGIDNRVWVYRACQKLGFTARTRSRIDRRLVQLGEAFDPRGKTIHKLETKLQEIKAEAGVAVHFMRSARESLAPDLYRGLEISAKARLADGLKTERANGR